MIIVRNIKLPLETDFDDLQAVITKKLNIKFSIKKAKLYKKAVDARRKDNIVFNCAVVLETDNDSFALKTLKNHDASIFEEAPYVFKKANKLNERPIVVGFGPAGMFAALSLAKAGLEPIVIERGKDADSRLADVNSFFATNVLNTESNIQFGEGGAGTFSDGKLNTGIKDPRIRAVLSIFVSHGAPKSILYDAKPHIGTDVLINVVKSIRREILSLGGEVLFCHKLVSINHLGGAISSISVETPNGNEEFKCNKLVLAVGHSARDTFLMLKNKGFQMQPKPFAVGARIEHLQTEINKAQYGAFASHQALGAADYRLAEHLPNGRGVFTFCMCPGGEVVNASSEQGRIAVNGMSYNARNGKNANSAVLVGVEVEDYYRSDVLDGMYFQREIEEKAYKFGNGLPLSQNLGEFLKLGKSDGSVTPTAKTGVTFGSISDCLPPFVTDSLREGILLFDRKLKGFAEYSAVLTAPETRSSSPIKLLRNEQGISSIDGIYPCGEGAGYAGGITSAAVDGLKTAENIIDGLL